MSVSDECRYVDLRWAGPVVSACKTIPCVIVDNPFVISSIDVVNRRLLISGNNNERNGEMNFCKSLCTLSAVKQGTVLSLKLLS